MITEEMWFMPQKVWTLEREGKTEVHVKIRGVEHVVISPLRNVHGRLEPVAELHSRNLSTDEIHAWEPMPFPASK
jgi:hypothetical protein